VLQHHLLIRLDAGTGVSAATRPETRHEGTTMHAPDRRLTFATFLLLLYVKSVAGGEFRSPAGYSFAYPEGWYVLADPRDRLDKMPLPPTIQAWFEKNHVDFSKVSAIAVRDGQGDFLENLNVVVSPGQMPVNDSTLKVLLEGIPKQVVSMGGKVEDLHGGVQKVGANEALAVEYRCTFPGTEFPMRQRQFYIPGGKTYIVTCTGGADTFTEYAPIFENILTSFTVPAPIVQGFDWSKAILAGIIGSVGGVLITLFKAIAGLRKPARRADEPPASA
jgi:hypothetical protein